MVRKVVFGLILLVFLMSFAIAIPDLEVEVVDKGSVVIAELDNPAVFDLIITNNGFGENFEMYSLVGVSILPRAPFLLSHGNNTIEVRAYPNDFVRNNRGLFLFDYEIKGVDSGIFKDQLLIKIVELKDVLDISAENIAPDDEKATITLYNLENTHFEDVVVNFNSQFFDFFEIVSLEPFGNASFEVDFDRNKFTGIEAGPYIITANIALDEVKTKIDGVINYLEREGVAVDKSSSGVLIRRDIITKTNVGNTPRTVEIEVQRNVVKRLFTGYSIAPLSSERSGVYVNYVWEQALDPGESFSVISTTNYTFPFILLLLIILIGFMVKKSGRTTVELTKRVSYVRTKNDDFALKIRISVKANSSVDNVEIVDRIPPTTRLYSGFGRKPDRVQEGSGKIEWDLGSLTSGEERVISYIIYSKIRVLGRFELSPAGARYEVGERKESVVSNRTFFMMDTTEQKNE